MKPPPTLTEWQRDGEFNGHTVADTLAWASSWGDFKDQQTRHRPLPPGVVSPDGVERRWVGRLRRWTGRGG